MTCRRSLFVFEMMLVGFAFAARDAQAWQEKKPEKTAIAPQHERVAELLDLLSEQNANEERFKDSWAQTLKEIVEFGPPAVPQLIAELDSTDNDMMLRCMGFALRAIGDRRAAPALIRAIPKTIRKPGSDMGCVAVDKEINAFMHKHDLDEKDEGQQHYSFGRPVREILGALTKLTGHGFDDEELFHVFLDGTVNQRRLKSAFFYRHAEKWAAWWDANAASQLKEEVRKDPAYAKVNLSNPAAPPEPKLAVNNLQHYRTESGGSNWMLESYLAPKANTVFYDFDTGRVAKLPAKWREEKNLASKFAEIEAWATQERFDLMGAEYVSPATGKKHFALRPLGLKAWQLAENRWKMETTDTTLEALISEGKLASNWLLYRDPQTQRIEPEKVATFLFKTEEGTPGLLFVGIEVHDDSLKPGGIAGATDMELDPVAFRKGRRFAFHFFEELAEK